MALPAIGAVFGPATRVETVPEDAMALDREGDRLYVAAGNELACYDISDPKAPRRLGAVTGVDNRRQVAVQNGFAYLVSRETGLRIVDFTDPAKPRIRSRFDSVEFATGVKVVGNVAFLSERINGVEFVDVTDPDNPMHIGIRRTPESQSTFYRNGYLYSGEWGSAEVTVFDVHDLANIRDLGRLPLHGFGDGLTVNGNHLYCSTGHESRHRDTWKGAEVVGRGRGMDIFALDDPAKPRWVSRIDFPRFTPRDEDFWTVRVAGGIAYCADSHNGLFAVDVKDPAKPKVIDRFCTPDRKHPDWPSAAISSLAVGEGVLYATAYPGGLFVIPIEGLRPDVAPVERPPVNISHRDAYRTDEGEFFRFRPAESGQARSVVVRGDVCYVAMGDAGLRVLGLGEKGFSEIGRLPNHRVLDCCFVGDRLVTAEGLDGFAVYELKGPAGFVEKQRRRWIAPSMPVAFWCWPAGDDHVILTGRRGPKLIYPMDNINAGSQLSMGGTCQWDRYAADARLGDAVANLVAYRGVQWVTFEGATPRLAAFDTSIPSSQKCGICAFDERRFLATFESHYKTDKDGHPFPKGPQFAFADRDERQFRWFPVPKGPKPFESFAGVPRTDGRWVALNNRSTCRVALYDFADLESPKFVKGWKLSGNPDCCAFWKGHLLIPAGHQGLLLSK